MRLAWLAVFFVAVGCSNKATQTAQIYKPHSIARILESLPTDHPQRAKIARVGELLPTLTAVKERGNEGPAHEIDVKGEAELWSIVSTLPVIPSGDHVLAHALEEVYTRPHPNYYHGYIWHYPYVSTKKTVTLVDKLLADYPSTPLAERSLWLKAFALRLAPPERNAPYEESFPIYKEQAQRAADPPAARAVYAELARRFPTGRYGSKSGALASSADSLELSGELFKGDPRE